MSRPGPYRPQARGSAQVAPNAFLARGRPTSCAGVAVTSRSVVEARGPPAGVQPPNVRTPRRGARAFRERETRNGEHRNDDSQCECTFI